MLQPSLLLLIQSGHLVSWQILQQRQQQVEQQRQQQILQQRQQPAQQQRQASPQEREKTALRRSRTPRRSALPCRSRSKVAPMTRSNSHAFCCIARVRYWPIADIELVKSNADKPLRERWVLDDDLYFFLMHCKRDSVFYPFRGNLWAWNSVGTVPDRVIGGP